LVEELVEDAYCVEDAVVAAVAFACMHKAEELVDAYCIVAVVAAVVAEMKSCYGKLGAETDAVVAEVGLLLLLPVLC
jgi:alpha-L-arabinofuranosidase